MANDITNIDGGATGQQVLGRITVGTSGRGNRARTSQQLALTHTDSINLSDIASKYDGKFDDPRYYTGDTTA